ncbi:MAG TPA: N-acetylglucosamine-6-phosphate deacetylase, partial [Candidatus Methylomirabilis sp.]
MSTSVVVQGRLTRGAAPVEILVAGGRIEAIRPPGPTTDRLVVGGADCLVTEGFLDIQVNGFAAVDFNRPELTVEELLRATRAMWRSGVTRFFPTVITASAKNILGTLKAIARAREQEPILRRAIPGIHLEGPFLAPEDGPRGAHPADSIRDPDWGLFQQFQDAAGGLIRLVTLAPERPGAIGLIWQLCQDGIVVGIGHSDAREADIDRAVEAGARISCHLGNGSHAMLPRHRNYIQKQLATDVLMASLIVDGHHLPSYVVKNMIRCKGVDRVILVTDAMAAAAAPPGKYRLGEVLSEVGPDGYVRLPGTPYLAGSALTMERAVE